MQTTTLRLRSASCWSLLRRLHGGRVEPPATITPFLHSRNNNSLRRFLSSNNSSPSSSGGSGEHRQQQQDESPSPRRRVEVKLDGKTGIAEVILNRPDKLNALDMAMFHGLQATAQDLARNRDLRVVILRGEGRAFCTGLDVMSIVRNRPIRSGKELLERKPLSLHSTNTEENSDHGDGNEHDDDDDDVEPNLQLALQAVSQTTNLAQDVSYLWRQLPVPVLCCIQGMCFGGGLQIALGADLRLATPDSQLSVMESVWGLIPDMSASVTLRELVRIDVAKELTFSGRRVSGTEAASLGLVTQLHDDPVAAARSLALQYADRSPDTLRLAKQLYQATWASASQTECLEMECQFQHELLGSWNQLAASGRNLTKWKIPYRQRGGETTDKDDDKKKTDGKQK